jgi:hypothetical protein
MTTHLNYVLARERSADLRHAADRAPIAQGGESSRLASRRRRLIARFHFPRRQRVIEPELRPRFTQAAPKNFTEDGLPC